MSNFNKNLKVKYNNKLIGIICQTRITNNSKILIVTQVGKIMKLILMSSKIEYKMILTHKMKVNICLKIIILMMILVIDCN